jgi:flavin reductase (DIM6/NTAB) family NADH-FMN oxidoreductase RutF
MELDLEGQLADRAYSILASLVTPRPIAFVTTVSPEGKINAAPFSFFNLLGADPPVLAVAPGDRDDGTPKDTARNIRLTHEFVVNLVDEASRSCEKIG